MDEIDAAQAARQLADDPENTLLLDVREDAELAAAAVDGALHIPMGQTPDRLHEIDPGKTVICMCHLGGRSAQVAAFLSANGYESVLNLAGGIDAWSQKVDTDVPRY
jgi:rhodanese-related sulfurtransferase